jgi:spermidine/putrescine transport system substrate-binding protein
VPAAQDYILNVIKDPTVANSPLVFPSAQAAKLSHSYYIYRDYNDYQAWNDTYNPIIES